MTDRLYLEEFKERYFEYLYKKIKNKEEEEQRDKKRKKEKELWENLHRSI